MKKIWYVILIVALVLLPTIAGGIENTYEMDAQIISVSDNGYTLIEDRTGNIWAYDTLKYTEGDQVIIIFDYNETPDRKDDFILKIKKQSWQNII